MLGFVVPLKSAKVSKSWEQVSQLFERTARSICNSTNPNFKVVVVCHEKPKINFEHPNLQYITVDLPVPTTFVEKRADKMHKIIRGIPVAKDLGCSYIMMVDADDCVSKFLTEFILKSKQSYGYFLNRGYLYNENNHFLRLRRKGFNAYCGSSHIIKSDLYDVSDQMLLRLPTKISDINLIPKDIYDLYYMHPKIVPFFKSREIILEPLPFLGAIYILGNLENFSSSNPGFAKQKVSLKQRLLKIKHRLFDTRILTPDIREEFGLYKLDTLD